jgi:ATP-dependent Clp protease ATP-binding subunit ClpC
MRTMYERFTDRSRRVLVLAQEEARDLTSSFIGTEHLLLGLIREREGIAAKVLDTLGVTYEVVREKVEPAFDTNKNASSASPAFTPRVKKVLEFSLREALQLGHSYVGTEHLLLGLVREGNGVAAGILDDLGVELTQVRARVIERITGQSDVESVVLEPLTEIDSDSGRVTSLVRKLGLSLRPDLDFAARDVLTKKIANELLDELRQRWADAAVPPSSTPET